MDIVKQIVDQRVSRIIEDYPDLFQDCMKDYERQRSQAFLLLGVAAFLNIDIFEAFQYITDGGNDGGFDAAYINQKKDGQLEVVLFQSKYTRDLEKDTNFPANAVEKAVMTIQCVFDPNRCMQLNMRSKQKVNEIQSFILDGDIPYVTYVMLNNGLRWNQDGQNHIDNAFQGQKQVDFLHFNHSDILNYVRQSDSIDATIKFEGNAIKEDFNYKSVIIGMVSVKEIYELVKKYGDSLFEKNIRTFLGFNAVNRGIRNTLLDDKEKLNFFFYNNGITMVCENFSYNALQKENWLVQAKKLQIINGGQTCKTIYQTLDDNADKDFSNVTVLLRLYLVGDNDDIIHGVTVATNSQNPVDFRDLKANDEKQVLLEESARELGYTYKRKKEGQNQSVMDSIPSSVAAEAVFAIWRRMPHITNYRKGEFFEYYYDTIFKDLNAAQMIVAVLIFRYCDNYRKKPSADNEVQAQRSYSQYVLAMLMGKDILTKCNITLEKLDHRNFNSVRKYFDENKVQIYSVAETKLLELLKSYFRSPLNIVDGRTLAAIFRRFEFIEAVLSMGNDD